MVEAVAVVALESVVRLMVTDGHPEEMVVPVLMAEALVTLLLRKATTTAAVVVVETMLLEKMVPMVLFSLFSNFKKNGNQILCKNR